MSIYFLKFLSVLFFGSALTTAAFFSGGNNSAGTAAEPVDDVTISKPVGSPTPRVSAKAKQIAVFAGGCFWGLEAVFEHVKGVGAVESGYSGGTAKTADYETVSGGETGHAEAVKITYDPSRVTYEQLLEVFFSVAHDPTELNRQGPDTGTQYRSAIFYFDQEQKHLAESYVARLGAAKNYARPVVTQIVALNNFYPAEAYHQDYLVRHPNQPYIVINDQPKVEELRKRFPDLYVSK
jgi:peptide-methionine (S)-S-oxide reductase